MDAINQLDSLKVDWSISQVPPGTVPDNALRQSVKRFVAEQKLSQLMPLRQRLYIVSISDSVHAEAIGWVLEDVAREAMIEFQKLKAQTVSELEPTPSLQAK